MSSKPNLPDPGEGRWWDISLDRDKDYILSLRKGYGITVFEDEELASVLVFKYDAKAETFEREAETILRQIDVDRELFVGTYHKN